MALREKMNEPCVDGGVPCLSPIKSRSACSFLKISSSHGFVIFYVFYSREGVLLFTFVVCIFYTNYH
jgi:hypothetical protein